MNITDVRIRRIYQDEYLKALVSITLDDDFAVHNLKVIHGPGRLFVAMPSEELDLATSYGKARFPDKRGAFHLPGLSQAEYERALRDKFRDIAHPTKAESRRYLEGKVIPVYNAFLEQKLLGPGYPAE